MTKLIVLVITGSAILLAAATFLSMTYGKRVVVQEDIVQPFTNPSKDVPRLSIAAKGLEVPWSLAFLPDNSLLVTERPGRVRLITKNGDLLPKPLLTLDVVQKVQGEGGLHGVTVHPDFTRNNYVYLYFTYENQGNTSLNRVVRYTLQNNRLIEDKIIIDKIPGALFHDGGRIKFGPDRLLYITTGDAQEPSLAQDKNSLAGKILRVTDTGLPAPRNPFGSAIFSFGHRNPQGITWDGEGMLWETEHGQSSTDELNRITAGTNYGWPTTRGDQKRDDMESPILQSGSDTWAPGGAAYLDGSIYFVGLRGEALYQALVSGNTKSLKTHMKGELGRLRDVVVGPDNMLYITTSNRDGRGLPTKEDDRIIRVNPTKL